MSSTDVLSDELAPSYDFLRYGSEGTVSLFNVFVCHSSSVFKAAWTEYRLKFFFYSIGESVTCLA